MTNLSRRIGAVAAIVLLGLVGCREEPTDWTPVLEETSTTFLQTLTERALGRVREGRERISDQPQEAMAALEEAEGVLQQLLDFYLPLFEARELTYNAYRELHLGSLEESARLLAEVESNLREVGRRDPVYHRAVEEPLQHVEAAMLALETGPEEGRRAIDVAASELNLMILKGDLLLAEE